MKTTNSYSPKHLGIALMAISAGSAMAAQTWIDTNANNNWDTSTSNWDGGVVWTNGSDAEFGGTGETVTVEDGVTVGNIEFTSGGYDITTGAGSVTLGASTVNTNGNDATFSTVLEGGSLNKIGSGNLTLSSYNTYTGGTTVNDGRLVLGIGGQTGAIRGALTIGSNGTVQLAATNALGWGTDRVSTLNINGGLLDNTSGGDNGWGQTINLTGGTMQSNGGVSTTGGQYYSFGGGMTINSLASATSSVIAGRLNLREGSVNNSGQFTVADGAAADDLIVSAAITNSGVRGITKNGEGTMRLTGNNTYTGGTTVNGGTLIIENTRNGFGLSVVKGTTTVNSGATLTFMGNGEGWGEDAGMTYNVNGGTINGTGGLGAFGVTYNLTGGTLAGSGRLDIGTINGHNGAINSLASSTTSVIEGSNSILIRNEQVGSLLTINTEDGAATTDLRIDRVIRGSAGDDGVVKTGAGTLQLTAANTYGGTTTVSAGTLNVSGSLDSSQVVVESGATIEGTGTLNNDLLINDGGILAPGASIGTLNVTGDLVLGAGALLNFELNGDNPLSGDQVMGINALTLDGTLNISELASFSGNAVDGDRWVLLGYTTLIDNGLVLGNSPTLDSGLMFELDQSVSGEIAILVSSTVPEPSSVAMILLGSVGLIIRRKRA